jgi:hypothetical protein
MSDFDSHYIAARRVLLDALSALAPHGKAIIVVGAQAVYLRTGEADLAIAPYTTDGDLAINPTLLGDDPLINQAMMNANFTAARDSQGNVQPGVWVTTADVRGQSILIPVDLMVPEAVAPPGGRRGARLGQHGDRSARTTIGLEAVLIDHSTMEIGSLDKNETRSLMVEVAGTSALLVAKAHKIHDRVNIGNVNRLDDKDASDVVRIMQSTEAHLTGQKMVELMANPISGKVTRDAVVYLTQLFGRRGNAGIQMAGRALQLAMPTDTVEVICTSYVAEISALISELDPSYTQRTK